MRMRIETTFHACAARPIPDDVTMSPSRIYVLAERLMHSAQVDYLHNDAQTVLMDSLQKLMRKNKNKLSILNHKWPS
jgi:hypothetical protein